VRSSTFTLASADGLALFVYRWLPEGTPKALVQIAHGLVEHAGRYARLAKALTRAGYAVYAGDHRGHGRTAPTPEDLGFFAERDGWRKCVDDLWGLNQRIAIDEHGEALSGVVLAGSNGKPVRLTVAVRIIARLERLRVGPRGRSALAAMLFWALLASGQITMRKVDGWRSLNETPSDQTIDLAA
jgi:alpha-beta hydrolase superfamily lysophospholipase